MPISLKKIIAVFNLTPKTHSQLETVVLEYGNLLQKWNNIEQQSWFFKKAEESNLLKLKHLKSQFKEIREAINSNTIDNLIEAVNSENEKIVNIKKMEMNSIINMGLAALNSRKAYLEELIEIKSRVDEMNKLDDYLENRKSLIKLLGW